MLSPAPRLLGKTSLFQKKNTWQTVSFDTLTDELEIAPDRLRSGVQAVYLQAQASTGEILPWLDIEFGPDHNNLPANIFAIQTAYLCLDDLELTQGMRVCLTGRAARFTWPWMVPADLAGAWSRFVQDKDTGLHIDPGPSKPGSFFRVFGYRGHGRQGKKPDLMDRHIVMLDNPDQLLTLTPQKYLELTQGQPDPADLSKIIDQLKPSLVMPDQWREHLEFYDRQSRLKRSFIQLKPAKKSTGTNWDAIETHLEQEGISRAPWSGNPNTFLLSKCPVCGQPHKSRMTSTGWLRCWRTTCAASDGIPPSQWVPDYQPSAPSGITYKDLLGLPSGPAAISQARENLADAITNSTDPLICNIPPGVGKSTTGAKMAVQLGREKLVLVSTPRRNLNKQFEAIVMQENAAGVPVVHLQGRTAGESEEKVRYGYVEAAADATCLNMKNVEYFARRGYSPAVMVCPGCPHKGVCAYQKQMADIPKTGILICSHEKAAYLSSEIQPDIWIVDEDPTTAMDKTFRVTADAIEKTVKSKLTGAAADALNKVRDHAEQLLASGGDGVAEVYVRPRQSGPYKDGPALWKEAGVTSDEMQALRSQMSAWDAKEGDTFATWQKWLHDEWSMDIHALNWVWAALGEKPGDPFIRVRRSKHNPVNYLMHKSVVDLTPAGKGCRVIVLDATGRKNRMDNLFGLEFREVDIQVGLPDSCKTVHLNYAMGITSLVGRENRTNPEKSIPPMPQDRLETRLKETLGQLRPQDKDVVIATFKGCEDRVRETARNLRPDLNIRSMHYFGNRGINDFEGCAVICFGTPRKPFEVAVEEAVRKGYETPESWNRYLQEESEDELYQTAHRGRPVYGDRAVVIVGNVWPERLGLPSITSDMRRKGANMERAMDICRDLIRRFGFLTRDLANMAGVGFRGDDDSVEAWAEVHQSVFDNGAFQRVPTSIRNYFIEVGTRQNIPLLRRKADWSTLVNTLAEELNLPTFREKAGSAWRQGVGYLTDVQDFCRTAEVEFIRDNWQGEYRPVAPGLNISRRVLPRPKVMACCAGSVSVLSSSKVKKKTTPPATPKSGVSPMPVKKSPIRPRISFPPMLCSVDARSVIQEQVRRGLAVMPSIPWEILNLYFEPEPPRLGLAI